MTPPPPGLLSAVTSQAPGKRAQPPPEKAETPQFKSIIAARRDEPRPEAEPEAAPVAAPEPTPAEPTQAVSPPDGAEAEPGATAQTPDGNAQSVPQETPVDGGRGTVRPTGTPEILVSSDGEPTGGVPAHGDWQEPITPADAGTPASGTPPATAVGTPAAGLSSAAQTVASGHANQVADGQASATASTTAAASRPVESETERPATEAPPGTGRPNATDQVRNLLNADREGSGDPAPQDDPGTRHPSLGRAMQVQAAVRVENATGQAPLLDLLGPKPAAQASVAANAGGLGGPVPGESAGLGAERPEMIGSQVLRGLSAMVNQRGGVMTMRLDPPDLGQLRVQMTFNRGMVTVQFQPSTQSAQTMLDQSMSSLRSALEGHGLTVERLTVGSPPPNHGPEYRDGATDDRAGAQRQQHDAGDGRSRGRHDDPAEQFDRRPGRSGEPFERAATPHEEMITS